MITTNACRYCAGKGEHMRHGIKWGCQNCANTGKAKGYRPDIFAALCELVEFYEMDNNIAMRALVYSACDMVEADDMSVSAMAHIKQALLFARGDLEGQMDYGSDTGPNRAMRLYQMVDEALLAFPKIAEAA